jgi:NAD(P)-dependent dehydrogenase (short-subunit alcohol dehydrogenase family)
VTTRFGGRSTAAEVAQGADLSGRRAIVTGGASGIGLETARALAGVGAEVTLAVRDLQAGALAARDITASTGNPAVLVAHLDLVDRASIAKFVAGWSGPLHVLINNAGIMKLPTLEWTAEGWEMQFATNHLGHVAVAIGLHDALAEAGSARIVVVSSSAHLRGPVVFGDLHFDGRPYDPNLAYGQSKTANVLFAVAATAHWAGDGITANALMPGTIATRLMRHLPDDWRERAREQFGEVEFKTPEQGAATSVLLATSPMLEGIGGRYFEDCNEAAVVEPTASSMSGVAPFAVDPDIADRLWKESLRLLG